MSYTNAQERALELLATGTNNDGRFHVHFYGPSNKAKRAAVMGALAGRKVSKSDALWGAFFWMLADNFAPGDYDCIADIEKAIVNVIGQHINRASVQYIKEEAARCYDDGFITVNERDRMVANFTHGA